MYGMKQRLQNVALALIATVIFCAFSHDIRADENTDQAKIGVAISKVRIWLELESIKRELTREEKLKLAMLHAALDELKRSKDESPDEESKEQYPQVAVSSPSNLVKASAENTDSISASEFSQLAMQVSAEISKFDSNHAPGIGIGSQYPTYNENSAISAEPDMSQTSDSHQSFFARP